MNKESFSIRRFRMSDVPEVVRLLRLVFERPFSSEWWNWKYRLNPAGFYGEEGDIWIAENADEKIVGYWAVIPERIKLGSETITVAQGVDAATHSEYRKLGIHRTLMKKVCSDAKNRYPFIFSFPIEILYKYRLGHGWKGLRIPEFLEFIDYGGPLRSHSAGNFVVWSRNTALKLFQVAKNFFPKTVANISGEMVEIDNINRFPDEIDGLWKEIRLECEICLERTVSFLNWRFSRYFGDYQISIARSTQNKKILGYLVLKKRGTSNLGNILDIVDLQVLPKEKKCLLTLIDTAITVAKNEKLDLIRCWVPPWHRIAISLSKRGFMHLDRISKFLKVPQHHMDFYPLLTEGAIPNFQRWFYTLADTDYA
jgi:GNAT superfamily N-acetyltransferase